MTNRQLAKILAVEELMDCSPATVRRMVKENRIAGVVRIGPDGAGIRFQLEEVERWIASGGVSRSESPHRAPAT